MKIKKRSITLLEIMIVIFLIGLIGGAIGVNLKGSIEKGKVFKTEQAQKQVKDVLLLQVAEGSDIDDVIKDPVEYLKESGLVKDPKEMLLDGWKKPFQISKNKIGDDIIVISETLDNYKKKSKKR